MIKVFTDDAWEDYLYWQAKDKKMVRRINELLKAIDRGGHTGIGTPEQLKHDLAGYWSRRIDSEHRLTYTIEEEKILVIKCRHHYE